MSTVSVTIFNRVAQLSHFAWGALVVLAPAAFGFPRSGLWLGGIFILYAVGKEFWYDPRYETPEEQGSGLLDFAVQAGAVVLAALALAIAGRP